MTHGTKTIHVEPGSELDRALEEAGEASVELERRGVRYIVTRLKAPAEEPDVWAGYDPALAIAGMRTAAGSWSDIDAESLKDYLYRARDEGSRPPDRP